ncbi:hypothetical protein [Aureitalea marina]|uniref:hypothetical protein n=1 Tax=Aureitalea marina TaxID=930804 RepID=UPI0015E3A652|nr:hypothetical protein [Aureitalea marina]
MRLRIIVIAKNSQEETYFVDYTTEKGKQDYLKISERAFKEGKTVIIRPILEVSSR